MKSIIIEPATNPDGIPEAIREILKRDGLYLGRWPSDPTGRMVPMWVKDGRVHSLKIDFELRPDRFLEGTQVDGPFNPLPPHQRDTKSAHN